MSGRHHMFRVRQIASACHGLLGTGPILTTGAYGQPSENLGSIGGFGNRTGTYGRQTLSGAISAQPNSGIWYANIETWWRTDQRSLY